MVTRTYWLAALAAGYTPAVHVQGGLFTPAKNGCERGDEYGCAAQYEAVGRLETGQPMNTVAGVTSGTLDCSELYDHEHKWTVDLSATETVTATKTHFTKGFDGFVTWCGAVDNEVGGELCVSWKVGKACSAENFHMSAVRPYQDGVGHDFESQAGPARRRRLADGTHETVANELAMVEVFRKYVDEEDPINQPHRSLELSEPELEYLPDGRKVKDVENAIAARLGKPVLDEHRRQLQITTRTDDGRNIDLLVLFTAKAATLAGSETAIRSSIATNYAKFATLFTNSGVNMTVTVVGVAQVTYVESGSLSTDLTSLRSGLTLTTGQTVAAYRTRIGADLVQLITNEPASCGFGYVLGPTATTAWASNGFSAIHYGCLGQYSHCHEVGHNMGMNHDVNNGVSSFGYGYGYQICSNGGYRTVMAYACASTTAVKTGRVLVYSSPTVKYANQYSGTAKADNKRVLTDFSNIIVANFYLSISANSADEATASAVVPGVTGGGGGGGHVKKGGAYSGEASTMSYILKGCYDDGKDQPDLDGDFTVMEDLTPRKCAAYCNIRGYKISGLQHGDECLCGQSYDSTRQIDPSQCNMRCSGDNSLFCGGTRKNAIYYVTGSAESYTHLGCYMDKASDPAFSGGSRSFVTVNSPEVCAEECADFKFFGLQDGTQCFCGEGGVGRYGMANSCNVPCPGDSTKICGGAAVNSVYSLRRSGFITYKGCFKDDADKRDLDGAAEVFDTYNSPQRCYSYCKDSGFKYFGLQDGKMCYCGSDYGSYGKVKGSAQSCDVPCVGAANIPCGGSLTNSVYGINF